MNVSPTYNPISSLGSFSLKDLFGYKGSFKVIEELLTRFPRLSDNCILKLCAAANENEIK